MNFPLSFFLGLLCTTSLFVVSYLLVVGAKTLLYALERFLPKKEVPPPPVKEPTVKKPKVVKSIEIDPALVDKIYVKKSS